MVTIDNIFVFIPPIGSINLWKKNNSKQKKQNKNLTKPTEEKKEMDHEERKLKISPVGDWRSTSLEWPWPWPWFRPYGIPSCITHRPLPTYQISLRSEEKFFWKSPLRFWSSSESRDTKTRKNIKNPARSNLDIVL